MAAPDRRLLLGLSLGALAGAATVLVARPSPSPAPPAAVEARLAELEARLARAEARGAPDSVASGPRSASPSRRRAVPGDATPELDAAPPLSIEEEAARRTEHQAGAREGRQGWADTLAADEPLPAEVAAQITAILLHEHDLLVEAFDAARAAGDGFYEASRDARERQDANDAAISRMLSPDQFEAFLGLRAEEGQRRRR